jgi:hypothetical protein
MMATGKNHRGNFQKNSTRFYPGAGPGAGDDAMDSNQDDGDRG